MPESVTQQKGGGRPATTFATPGLDLTQYYEQQACRHSGTGDFRLGTVIPQFAA